jgi:peptide-methionine (R)-S-oxide reductase
VSEDVREVPRLTLKKYQGRFGSLQAGKCCSFNKDAGAGNNHEACISHKKPLLACVSLRNHYRNSTAMKRLLLLVPCVLASLLTVSAQDKPQPAPKTVPTAPDKVTKTDEEWRKLLTPEQYRVTRTAGTERPFGEAYEEFNKQGEGTYYCVCCGAELFTSNEKFHSGCGWPSFYDSSKAKGVLERRDDSHGMVRIETVCKRCDAHLGHVFEGEGYKTPTNRRFCINAAALKFVPAGGEKPAVKDLDQAKKDAADARKKDEGK